MDNLPLEVQKHVLSFLKFSDLFRIKSTNHLIHDYASENMLGLCRLVMTKKLPDLMGCLEDIDCKLYGGQLAHVMGIAECHNNVSVPRSLYVEIKERDVFGVLYHRLKGHRSFVEVAEYRPCRAFIYSEKRVKIVLHLGGIFKMYLPLAIEKPMFILAPRFFRTELKTCKKGDTTLTIKMHDSYNALKEDVAFLMAHRVKVLVVPASETTK